jgi:hypothetical protein
LFIGTPNFLLARIGVDLVLYQDNPNDLPTSGAILPMKDVVGNALGMAL